MVFMAIAFTPFAVRPHPKDSDLTGRDGRKSSCCTGPRYRLSGHMAKPIDLAKTEAIRIRAVKREQIMKVGNKIGTCKFGR
jgi:hypothetical protein